MIVCNFKEIWFGDDVIMTMQIAMWLLGYFIAAGTMGTLMDRSVSIRGGAYIQTLKWPILQAFLLFLTTSFGSKLRKNDLILIVFM